MTSALARKVFCKQSVIAKYIVGFEVENEGAFTCFVGSIVGNFEIVFPVELRRTID